MAAKFELNGTAFKRPRRGTRHISGYDVDLSVAKPSIHFVEPNGGTTLVGVNSSVIYEV